MKRTLYFLSALLFFNTLSCQSSQAADGNPPYTLLIRPADQEQLLRAPLEKALNGNRANLERAGVVLAPVRLARQETTLLKKVLHSEGYYGAAISMNRTQDEVSYSVAAGPAYRLESFRITGGPPGIDLPDPGTLGLRPGMQLRAATILTAEERLDQHVRDHNCLWQPGSSHEVTLDHGQATGSVLFTVNSTSQVRFGEVTIDGLSSVKKQYVREKLAIETGQCYQNRSIERGRLRLLQTGLFAVVETRAEAPESGQVRVHLDLKENHHRTVTAGLGFSTDEGLSLTAGWVHRNFFGAAEQLEVESKASALYKGVETKLTIPSFRRAGQALILEASAFDENTDAFDTYGGAMGAKLKRQLADHLNLIAGGRYQYKIVSEGGVEDPTGLFSLPLSLEYDSRDNILDPRRGWVAAATIEPFLDTLDTNVVFIKSSLAASIYRSYPAWKWSPTFAARAVAGTINGISTTDIPAHERFYSGGGGSVRGYGFQQLGTQTLGEPDGGRSLAEISLEARLRFTETWGGVVFMDGGNVYDDPVPLTGGGLRWSAGMGVRYTTAFAPVRIDLAFPINRRSVIDDPFQIYISLAQAF